MTTDEQINHWCRCTPGVAAGAAADGCTVLSPMGLVLFELVLGSEIPAVQPWHPDQRRGVPVVLSRAPSRKLVLFPWPRAVDVVGRVHVAHKLGPVRR